jgi:hypothetical protein
MLKDSVDFHFGLKEQGVSDFSKNFLRQVFALATRPDGLLPASFFAVTKSENGVSSHEGIMAKLGFVAINPSVNKIINSCTQNYKNKEDGTIFEVYTQKEETLPHDKNFHMGVKFLLPYISKRDDISSQLNRADQDLSTNARDYYKTYSNVVTELNRSYAFLSAHRKNKKKTKAASVVSAIVKASNLSAKMPYMRKDGKTYSSYMDIPNKIRKHLEKLLKRRKSPNKRSREDAGPESDGETVDPKGKQSKKSRGNTPKASSSTAKKETTKPMQVENPS